MNRHLQPAVGVDGANGERVRPGTCHCPTQRPLPPRVRARGRSQLGPGPWLVVDLHFHTTDTRVLMPGQSRDGGGVADHGVRAGPGQVDTRRELDRRLPVPAAGHPVRPPVVERGGGDPVDPLARRDVAVQAGHHHAHRKAVHEWERFAVHADCQHRVPAVEDRGGGHPDGGAVLAVREQLVGARMHPCLAQQRGQRRAEESRRADQVATDVVGHAGDGDPALDHRTGQELRERERHRAVDHPVDAQLPGVGINLRDAQGDVHAVEVAVGRVERRRGVELGPGRQRRRGRGRRRQPHRVPGRRRGESRPLPGPSGELPDRDRTGQSRCG